MCEKIQIGQFDCVYYFVLPLMILINEGKVSCSRKQQEPLMGFESKTDHLQVRRATHCATPRQIYMS